MPSLTTGIFRLRTIGTDGFRTSAIVGQRMFKPISPSLAAMAASYRPVDPLKEIIPYEMGKTLYTAVTPSRNKPPIDVLDKIQTELPDSFKTFRYDELNERLQISIKPFTDAEVAEQKKQKSFFGYLASLVGIGGATFATAVLAAPALPAFAIGLGCAGILKYWNDREVGRLWNKRLIENPCQHGININAALGNIWYQIKTNPKFCGADHGAIASFVLNRLGESSSMLYKFGVVDLINIPPIRDMISAAVSQESIPLNEDVEFALGLTYRIKKSLGDEYAVKFVLDLTENALKRSGDILYLFTDDDGEVHYGQLARTIKEMSITDQKRILGCLNPYDRQKLTSSDLGEDRINLSTIGFWPQYHSYLNQVPVAKSEIPADQFNRVAHLFTNPDSEILVFKPNITKQDIDRCDTIAEVKTILQQAHQLAF